MIAQREGVDEKTVLQKLAANDKPRLRLTREQREDQQALEDELAFAKKEMVCRFEAYRPEVILTAGAKRASFAADNVPSRASYSNNLSGPEMLYLT